MKALKKGLSLLLAAVMVLALSVVAFADNGYTISVKSGDTHTYTVYQIFTGDLANGVLSNVKWGTDGTGETGTAVPEDTLTAIQTLTGSDQAKADAISRYVTMTGDGVGNVSANAPLSGLAAGYYILKDVTTLGEYDSYSTYIVEVVGNVEVEGKTGTVDFQKKLKDTNDSEENSTTDWQDSADYDIGDAIPFKLEGTVAANYASYTTYKFIFHDVEEESLTFQNVTSVYVLNGNDKTEIDSQYYTVNKTPSDDCTFEVSFPNLKNVAAVQAGSKIVVEYSSKLNDKAVLGSQGNVNKAQLEYSNNPNNSQEGGTDNTGKTPWDNVIVFTYKVVVNKVDKDQKALAGAGFELQKYSAATNAYETVKKIDAGEATSFTFSGLDDGKYKLVETETPAGYNSIDPIEFTVTAAHEITWDKQTRNAILTSLTGNAASGEITFTPVTKEGSLTTDVVNKKGTELPSTGGMGTTIFYVMGTILVLGAGVVLVSKKRMGKAD